jgi:drug/metabolite transporter (DMT)-like permease
VLGLGFALAAAVAWGASDFIGGLTTRGLAVVAVLLASQGFGAVLLATVVLARDEPAPETTSLLFGALAGLALAVGLGGLYQGMAIGIMSVVSPISATGAVVPVAFGLARGERPTALQGLGVALALGGVVLVSRRRDAEGTRTPLAVGVGLALLSAAGFGLFFVSIDLAADAGVLWATLMQRLGVVAAAGTVLLLVRPKVAFAPRHLPALLTIGVLDVVATTLFATATTEGLTSLVSVVASLYPVTTIALAYAVLRERLARSQQLGAAGALGGVALIAGG